MADRLRVTELDFDTIKSNLKTFLNQQTTFTDYNFEGSGLSILLDLLAYNTHYNAYYLNMVANESFLDTSVLRGSTVSHAKTLGYIPYSITAPIASIDFTVDSGTTTAATLTIPAGFSFLSNQIDSKSYNFIVLNDTTVTKSNTSFYFENLEIYEGQLVTYNFTYDQATNPKQIFILPDVNIDTTTISVSVSPSSGNTQTSVYSKVTDVLNIDSNSNVYYLQEGRNSKYEIYFGNDVIGSSLSDGSIVSARYLITNGTSSNKANNFVATGILTDSLNNSQTNFNISPLSAAAGGSDRESVDSIKFSAAAQYTTQNRLVTLKDYESYLKTNYPNIDSLSVWGGEDETPPVYGKVFISLKPKMNYYITETEKQRIINDIIKPKSIIAITTEIIDPEYLYILVENYVQYNKTKTTSSSTTIKNTIKEAIKNYRDVYLNKFDSIFVLSKVQDVIDNTDLNSIIGSKTILKLQKRFEPTLGQSSSYDIQFNVELHRGTTTNKLSSTPFDVYDSDGTLRNVILEEVPESFTGVSEILVTNAGSGYITAPTITITGDGTGATASAVIVNGRIESITVVNRGINYSRSIVTISGGSGYGASATAVLDGKYGTLRTVWFDSNATRQIVNSTAGIINYTTGLITLNSLRVISLATFDDLIRITIESEKGIIKSYKNTIITIDDDDTTAITTELVEA